MPSTESRATIEWGVIHPTGIETILPSGGTLAEVIIAAHGDSLRPGEISL